MFHTSKAAKNFITQYAPNMYTSLGVVASVAAWFVAAAVISLHTSGACHWNGPRA